jgi:hypothetical protein
MERIPNGEWAAHMAVLAVMRDLNLSVFDKVDAMSRIIDTVTSACEQLRADLNRAAIERREEPQWRAAPRCDLS